MDLSPDFFIPGAQKSGTSSLASWLADHPGCMLTDPKEPRVFSKEKNLKNPAPYREFLRGEEPQDRLLFDATASYMYEDYVPMRIHNALGKNKKFIFVLREPAARTISAYYHIFKRGHDLRLLEDVFDHLPATLDQALQQEQERVLRAGKSNQLTLKNYKERYDDPFMSFYHLRNSDYLPQLKRYEALFSRKNMHVVLFEDLQASPQHVLDDICAFLEIAPFKLSADLDEQKNPTMIPFYMSWPWARKRPVLMAFKGVQHVLTQYLKVPYTLFYQDYDRDAAQTYAEKIRPLFIQRRAALSDYLKRDLGALGW